MPLTAAQKRKVARRTTPSSKARLRKRYQGGGGKPSKAKPKRPDPLYNPAAPLSGTRLKKAAQQLTSIEFGSERDSLKRAMGQVTRQGGELQARASDYYTQLAQQEAGAVARSQAIGSELQGRLGTVGAESQQQLSAIEQEAAQRAAADVAVRGPGLSGGGQERVAAEIAAARGLSTAGTQQAQEAGALSTSNWANLANIANTARGMAGGQAVTQLGNQLSSQQADIRGRQNDLSRQVAAKRVQNVLQLRQQGFENTLAARGLDVDLKEIEADMQQDRAANRLAGRRITSAERQNRLRVGATRRGQDITRRGQDMTAKQRAADRAARERIAAARKQGGKKVESSDARKIKVGIGNALIDLQNKKPKNPTRWLIKQGAPGIMAQAAAERYKYGGIRPSTAAELRRMGVRVPKGWLGAFSGPPTPQ